MHLSRKKYVLIADPDPEFLETMRLHPKASAISPLLCQDRKSAQLQLADRNVQLTGIFVNPRICDTYGLSLVRFAHQNWPMVPIFLIHGDAGAGEIPFSEEDLRKLGIRKTLHKPFNYAQLLELVEAPALMFDPQVALQKAAGNKDALGVEAALDDSEFVPIRADDFLSGSRSLFDVYVRLNSSRYLKILQAGDAFSEERVNGYLAKGVTHFHIRKALQEQYLSYCDKLASAIIRKSGVAADIKISQALNHGEEVMSFLRNGGISDAGIAVAAKFVDNVNELVHQIQPQKNDVLRDFMADLAGYEHGVSVSVITGMIASALSIDSDQAVRVIGVAALFHDIGLSRLGLPPECMDEERDKMTAEQVKVFETHPSFGAELLRKVKGIDSGVIQAVAHHHRRRNHKGFPHEKGVAPMSRVAEIVGISDEFLHWIRKAKNDPKIDPLQKMEYEVFDGFSGPVAEAFRRVFFMVRVKKTG